MEQMSDMMQPVLKSTGVLVVYGMAAHRETLCAILEDTGYKVTEAHDGEQAISLVQEKHHDIVLMDISMPGIDGFATFQEIQKIDPRVKVLFVTGYALNESVREALQEGAYSVLTKPVDPNDLLTLIKSITGRQLSQSPAIR